MPNIKPCGVDSTDCPACGAQHPHGDGANGKPDGELDASIESCRSCLWTKRIKPLLYDQGVTYAAQQLQQLLLLLLQLLQLQ